MLVVEKRHFVALLALILVFLGISLVQAWSGPTAAPPNNNVSAPLNVSGIDQVKDAGLSLNSLAVFGNALLSGLGADVGRYLNFDYTTGGTSGVGSAGMVSETMRG